MKLQKQSSTFKILAEVQADKNYFDLDEIETIIGVYFKIWLSDIRSNEELDDIIIKRNRILSEKEQIDIQKNIIERQLLEAKSMLREGRWVDTSWMARANLAFRIKKSQIVQFQADLTNLKTIEKKRRIETANTEERIFLDKLKDFIFDLIGNDKSLELFTKIRSEIDSMTRDDILSHRSLKRKEVESE